MMLLQRLKDQVEELAMGESSYNKTNKLSRAPRILPTTVTWSDLEGTEEKDLEEMLMP